MIYDFVDKIYCINSSNHPERYDSAKTELQKINITVNDKKFERIEAIYPSEKDISTNFNGKLGHYGCILSHRLIYEKMFTENIHTALILEDDIWITNNYGKYIDNILNDLSKLDFDIFYFHDYHGEEKTIEEYDSGLLKKEKCPKTTHAYILKYNPYSYFQNIDTLLSSLHCRHHIDIILKEHIPFINVYASKHRLIWQKRKEFKSHIKNSKLIIGNK